MNTQYEKKATSVRICKVTEDLACIVKWHLLRRDCINRTNRGRGVHQLLKPSQNQFRWEGCVRGDDMNRRFFSDNVRLVQKMTLNHARNIMRSRIVEYQKALND